VLAGVLDVIWIAKLPAEYTSGSEVPSGETEANEKSVPKAKMLRSGIGKLR